MFKLIQSVGLDALEVCGSANHGKLDLVRVVLVADVEPGFLENAVVVLQQCREIVRLGITDGETIVVQSSDGRDAFISLVASLLGDAWVFDTQGRFVLFEETLRYRRQLH